MLFKQRWATAEESWESFKKLDVSRWVCENLGAVFRVNLRLVIALDRLGAVRNDIVAYLVTRVIRRCESHIGRSSYPVGFKSCAKSRLV